MQIVMLAFGVVLVAFDFQNLLSWWRGRVISPGDGASWDFTIVVPLFGHPRYFAGRDGLRRYQANVLVALEVTTPIMKAFALQLEREGWRVSRMTMADPNPAMLVKEALAEVTTTYALRLDADTTIGGDLERVVAAVRATGADICSTKIAVSDPRSVPAKLQALEYRMAMLSRHFRPWLTSGACFLGKTHSLREIYERHSLWTPGEDIETGRAAHALKMRIRHADFEMRTEAPETWRALFRQRRLWWAGTFRFWVVNADRNAIHLPVMTTYMLLAVFASLYYKWWELIDVRRLPYELPVLLGIYVVVTFVSNVQVRSWWMLVFPAYALAQTLVMPAVGACTYVSLACRRGRLGRYRFGYRRGVLFHSWWS